MSIINRIRGHDYNECCMFIVPPSHEFSDKNEFITIATKYINKCIKHMEDHHYVLKDKYINDILYVRDNMLEEFYDRYENRNSIFDSHVLKLNDLVFYLFRSTRINGWQHDFVFNYISKFGNNPRNLYIPLISKTIDKNEIYTCWHIYDQKMFQEHSFPQPYFDMYDLHFGAPIYEDAY